MTLLLIDVGNTETVVGIDGEDPTRTWRIATSPARTSDEYVLLLRSMIGDMAGPVDGAALSSVVPAATKALRVAIRNLTGVEPVVVGPGTRTGMSLRIDNPREVGADRIVNALGAVDRYGAPVVTVDFGTATTVDLIGAGGEYRGGAIAPGIGISAEALVRSTAALRHVDIVAPIHAVGRSTAEAIQSGLVYGYAGLVDGLLDRITAEHGSADVTVVATGGMAEAVIPHCTHSITLDPGLTLRGLRVVWERNRDR